MTYRAYHDGPIGQADDLHIFTATSADGKLHVYPFVCDRWHDLMNWKKKHVIPLIVQQLTENNHQLPDIIDIKSCKVYWHTAEFDMITLIE